MRYLFWLLPFYKSYRLFAKTPQNTGYFEYLKFKLRINKIHFPIHENCIIANPKGIKLGINCLFGRPGVYIQGGGGVSFGNYVQLGPNVGILSSNHDLYNQYKMNNAKIVIGDYSWIGMNSVVTAGVELGTRTVVAAGSVVTKSFPEGFCVLGGVPAKIIKKLNKDEFVPWRDDEEFIGFKPFKKES